MAPAGGGGGGGGNIKVVVRVRPFNGRGKFALWPWGRYIKSCRFKGGDRTHQPDGSYADEIHLQKLTDVQNVLCR